MPAMLFPKPAGLLWAASLGKSFMSSGGGAKLGLRLVGSRGVPFFTVPRGTPTKKNRAEKSCVIGRAQVITACH